MPGESVPVSHPVGRAIVVASAAPSGVAAGGSSLAVLHRMGLATVDFPDPYAAMAELARRPELYRVLVLSLNSLFREELAVIRAVKVRYPHVEVWLAHADGRMAALAEAMRSGVDGLLSEDGLHRIGVPSAVAPAPQPAPPAQATQPAPAPFVPPPQRPAAAAPARPVPPAPVAPGPAPEAPLPVLPLSYSQSLAASQAPDDDDLEPAPIPETLRSFSNLHARPATAPQPAPAPVRGNGTGGDPVLTAEELRALLQDDGSPDGENE